MCGRVSASYLQVEYRSRKLRIPVHMNALDFAIVVAEEHNGVPHDRMVLDHSRVPARDPESDQMVGRIAICLHMKPRQTQDDNTVIPHYRHALPVHSMHLHHYDVPARTDVCIRVCKCTHKTQRGTDKTRVIY